MTLVIHLNFDYILIQPAHTRKGFIKVSACYQKGRKSGFLRMKRKTSSDFGSSKLLIYPWLINDLIIRGYMIPGS
jgi:hypothetical protein